MKRKQVLIPVASIILILIVIIPIFLNNDFMDNSELKIVYFIAKGAAILLFLAGFSYLLLNKVTNHNFYILSFVFLLYQLMPLFTRLIIKHSDKPVVWSVILLLISILIVVLVVGIIIIINDERFNSKNNLRNKKKEIENENKNQQVM